jgi:hypothetical protein
VLDAETSRLLFMVEGRSAQALEAFAQALRAHGAEPAQIEAIALDMSPAYVKGATVHFPQATIVFDKFHLMMLAGQALDEVRRGLQGQGAELKGALWSLRGNGWNLSEERQAQRKTLCRQYTQLGRAMSLRETLQAIYASPDRAAAEKDLQWWCGSRRAQSPGALSCPGQDRSPALGGDPGLLRHPPHLRRHRGRQWYDPARQANGSWIQKLRLLPNRRLSPSRQAQLTAYPNNPAAR